MVLLPTRSMMASIASSRRFGRRDRSVAASAAGMLRTTATLLDDEAANPTASMLALVDVANGLAARISPDLVAFPNLDLTVHLFREPEGGWLGLDTTASFGSGGIGMTHSILHDAKGVFGAAVQSLTIRPR